MIVNGMRGRTVELVSIFPQLYAPIHLIGFSFFNLSDLNFFSAADAFNRAAKAHGPIVDDSHLDVPLDDHLLFNGCENDKVSARYVLNFFNYYMEAWGVSVEYKEAERFYINKEHKTIIFARVSTYVFCVFLFVEFVSKIYIFFE